VICLLRRVAPVVALVLLAWTAFDLANPQCCLQEQSPTSGSSTLAALSTTHTPQPDVDDCFCCARCIDTGTRIPHLRAGAAWVDFADPVRNLTTRSSSLDHPPQNT
jgi:hypothetical protein